MIIVLLVVEMGIWVVKGILYEWNYVGIIGV